MIIGGPASISEWKMIAKTGGCLKRLIAEVSFFRRLLLAHQEGFRRVSEVIMMISMQKGMVFGVYGKAKQ